MSEWMNDHSVYDITSMGLTLAIMEVHSHLARMRNELDLRLWVLHSQHLVP
jgi:hypothetical protein